MPDKSFEEALAELLDEYAGAAEPEEIGSALELALMAHNEQSRE